MHSKQTVRERERGSIFFHFDISHTIERTCRNEIESSRSSIKLPILIEYGSMRESVTRLECVTDQTSPSRSIRPIVTMGKYCNCKMLRDVVLYSTFVETRVQSIAMFNLVIK